MPRPGRDVSPQGRAPVLGHDPLHQLVGATCRSFRSREQLTPSRRALEAGTCRWSTAALVALRPPPRFARARLVPSCGSSAAAPRRFAAQGPRPGVRAPQHEQARRSPICSPWYSSSGGGEHLGSSSMKLGGPRPGLPRTIAPPHEMPDAALRSGRGWTTASTMPSIMWWESLMRATRPPCARMRRPDERASRAHTTGTAPAEHSSGGSFRTAL